MSFFSPFFFLLLDSALGSDFSGVEAVCSLLVPLPGAALGAAPGAVTTDVDSPAGVSVGDAAAGAAPAAAGAGCSVGGVEASGAELGSIGFGKLPASEEPGATSLVPAGFPEAGGAAVVSPVESPDPAGTVSTAIEFPPPAPPPDDRTPGTAPGFKTSVAEVASTGGVKLGAPLRAAIEVSGPVLMMPMERRTTPGRSLAYFFCSAARAKAS